MPKLYFSTPKMSDFLILNLGGWPTRTKELIDCGVLIHTPLQTTIVQELPKNNVGENNGLVVKALDFQSRCPVFKTTGWLQDRPSLLSFRGRSCRNFWEIPVIISPQTHTTSYNFITITHEHLQPAIISPLPPTTTHDQP